MTARKYFVICLVVLNLFSFAQGWQPAGDNFKIELNEKTDQPGVFGGHLHTNHRR